jgi:hypothetical protein
MWHHLKHRLRHEIDVLRRPARRRLHIAPEKFLLVMVCRDDIFCVMVAKKNRDAPVADCFAATPKFKSKFVIAA